MDAEQMVKRCTHLRLALWLSWAFFVSLSQSASSSRTCTRASKEYDQSWEKHSSHLAKTCTTNNKSCTMVSQLAQAYQEQNSTELEILVHISTSTITPAHTPPFRQSMQMATRMKTRQKHAELANLHLQLGDLRLHLLAALLFGVLQLHVEVLDLLLESGLRNVKGQMKERKRLERWHKSKQEAETRREAEHVLWEEGWLSSCRHWAV